MRGGASMEKSFSFRTACFLFLAGFIFFISACRAQPSVSQIQTAVAGTLEAAPFQPGDNQQVVEVTQVREVTKIVEIQVTSAVKATEVNKATATPQPKITGSATLTSETVEETPQAPTGTAVPVQASGPLGLTLTGLVRRYDGMTDLQKQDFVASLPGKTVKWTAQVSNINQDGTINLYNPYYSGKVTMKGVPFETAIYINKGMLVEFSGTIESFGGTLVPDVTVVDVKIIRYYEPPTPTPTPTF
jgi:hypothetical protein